MLSKSKIKKLKAELNGYGVTINQLAEDKAVGIGRSTVIKLLAGETYNATALKRIIEIRDEKKREADNLLKSI